MTHNSKTVDISTTIRLRRHTSSLFRTHVTQLRFRPYFLRQSRPTRARESMLERPEPRTEIYQPRFPRHWVHVEGIAPDFTMHDPLSMV